ncbi:MAG: hypothetical protein NT062_24560 [Proteobacteria bacterium]|nr:hypothetical protein [Pseudomonadota bacterium]
MATFATLALVATLTLGSEPARKPRASEMPRVERPTMSATPAGRDAGVVEVVSAEGAQPSDGGAPPQARAVRKG